MRFLKKIDQILKENEFISEEKSFINLCYILNNLDG